MVWGELYPGWGGGRGLHTFWVFVERGAGREGGGDTLPDARGQGMRHPLPPLLPCDPPSMWVM